jgi:hypothetical protein
LHSGDDVLTKVFAVFAVVCVSQGAVCFAQESQVGIAAGFGLYNDAMVTSSSGSVQAGFSPRLVTSAVVGHRFPNHFALEGRYTFQDGNSELRSGVVQTTLDADAHSVLGELLWYPTSISRRWRPFLAAGTGLKVYQATEAPTNRPPLSFGTLGNVSQTKPLITFGGGIQYVLLSGWALRADVRDYGTPFPNHVFNLPSDRAGWVHDFVPTIGVSHRFVKLPYPQPFRHLRSF